MKKIFSLVLLVVLLIPRDSKACDICGCGVSNYNPFLFPHLTRSYVSVSYIHRSYVTYSDGIRAGKENYNTVLLSGQYSISKKLRLLATIPYQLNRLSNENGRTNRNGVGDVSVLANYQMLDKSTGPFRHSVTVGAGIKLPTGKHIVPKTETLDDQNFQLGTGSVDNLLNAAYRITYKNWMVAAATSYKYNTANKSGYRYGDILTNGISVIYRIDKSKYSFAPYLQVINETQMKDAKEHALQPASGGNVVYTGAGVDMTTRKFTTGINFQNAPVQDLAQGQIGVKPRLTVHLAFNL